MIKFIDYGASYQRYKEELDAVWKRVNETGKYVLQEDNEIFEKTLASYVGTRFAVGVGNGTDALVLSLRAAGIRA